MKGWIGGARFKKAVSLGLRVGLDFESKIRALPDHPKLDALREIVRSQLLSKPESKILVFNHYRDSIENLVLKLRGWGIQTAKFVGRADRGGSEGMSQADQLKALEELRRKKLQVLVLSSVGEEGLDIPSADLVCFYEPVPSEIRFIQRKGRTGRIRAGRAVILVADRTIDLAYQRVSLRKAERMREIVGRLDSELEPLPRGPEPPRCQMPPEEMAPREVEPLDIPTPEDARRVETRQFRRALRENTARVLDIAISAGSQGMEVEEAAKRVGISRDELGPALERLVEEGVIEVAGSRIQPAGFKGKGEIRRFDVERIFKGGAILRVDGKWYARLEAPDYQGPRSILKPEISFKARSELFHTEEKLHARIFAVVEASKGAWIIQPPAGKKGAEKK